ncbi:MAG: hypothetical protein SFX18_11935 [Pirellulales bacterium]|nr:hypothetical protein [Pirellulales bacterium]
MHVNRAAPLVPFVDTSFAVNLDPAGQSSSHQIAVKDSHQARWHIQQGSVRWQFTNRGGRLEWQAICIFCTIGLLLVFFPKFLNPAGQISRQVLS